MNTRAKAPPIRVLCVDDHAFLVNGLKIRLEVESDMEFVGRLETADDLIAHVQRTQANIVLLDIDMPGADVFEAIDELRRRCPETRAILLSAYLRDQYLDSAFASGAWGYLSKGDSPDAVIEGIRKVAKGETAFSPDLMAHAQPTAPKGGGLDRAASSKISLLTARERQILRMIANGMSRTAIAEQLCRSPMTIDNHRKSILKKLGVHDRVELVRYAIAEGLGELLPEERSATERD
ncbi:MAG: LuxR C-terminal-related transcriptional regulator [Planctomycetota bacterium]|jgi:two-component system response regulator NreC